MLNTVTHAFKATFSSLLAVSGAVASAPLSPLSEKVADWRRDRDIGTIMAAFHGLSDRHLSMIGINDRDEIYYHVAELMAQSEERKQIAKDVARILDETPEVGEMTDPSQRASEKGKVVSVAA